VLLREIKTEIFMLKVLYLCNKKYYETKMSRVRFHSISALKKVTDLRWSGPSWDNYDDTKTVQENIDIIYVNEPPDVVIAYKPLEMKKYDKIKSLRCIRYNEMWDKSWTIEEITKSKANLIICHHSNEAEEYRQIFRNFNLHPLKFAPIPHCAEATIFKDYQHPKQYDIILIGALRADIYPLRKRLHDILRKMSSSTSYKYNVAVISHPGYEVTTAYSNKAAKEYAEMINSAKIVVSCGSIYNYRLGKYVEVPMCNTALAADMPLEQQEEFSKFLIQIDMSMSDEEIINKLVFYLENEDERNMLCAEGKKYADTYTQEKYAQDFISIVEEALA